MSFWNKVKCSAAELGETIQELGERAQVQIDKAKQSEASKRIQEGSLQAWESTKGMATSVRDKASEAITNIMDFLE